MLFIVTRTLLNISLRQFLLLFAIASTIGTSLIRLPEKNHYAINKPISCLTTKKLEMWSKFQKSDSNTSALKTKKKLFCQRPSKLRGIFLWTSLFFVCAFVALVIEKLLPFFNPFVAKTLKLCNDVESNPGPSKGERDQTQFEKFCDAYKKAHPSLFKNEAQKKAIKLWNELKNKKKSV